MRVSRPPESAKRSRPNAATKAKPRKRARLSRDDEDDHGKEEDSVESQQTLTQIDFVRTPTPGRQTPTGRSRQPLRYGRNSLLKRDSTLTQMDFLMPVLDSPAAHETGLLSDTLERPRQRRLPQVDGTVELEGRMLPPLRPSFSRIDSEEMRITSTPGPDAGAHKPRTPWKRSRIDTRQETTSPRKSPRLQRRTPVKDSPDRRSKGTTRPPRLLVRDSTDFDDPPMLLGYTTEQLVTPNTPDRPDRVLSSQTPETIKKVSTARFGLSPSRPALAEMPANIPIVGKPRGLKLPDKAALPIPQSTPHAAGKDIWSVHATSSPSQRSQNPVSLPDLQSTGPAEAVVDDATFKQADTHPHRFPSTTEIHKLAASSVGIQASSSAQTSQEAGRREYRLSADPDNGVPKCSKSTRLFPISLHADINASEDEGETDGIGSPVRNDTQFVSTLDDRTSSPNSDYLHERATRRRARSHVSDSPDTPKSVRRIRVRSEASPVKTRPMPSPRLVRGVETSVSTRESDSMLTFKDSTISTSTVTELAKCLSLPANSVVQRDFALPAIPNRELDHGKSQHFMSIPRPSQISTQAASTQAVPFLPLRSSDLQDFPQSLRDDFAPTSSPILMAEGGMDTRQPDRTGMPSSSYSEDEVDLDPTTPRKKQKAKQPPFLPQDPDITQSPTQKSISRTQSRRILETQESPVIMRATTKTERDAALDVIVLDSSQPARMMSSQAYHETQERVTPSKNRIIDDILSSSPSTSGLYTPSPPRRLSRKFTPIPGFNNDTQSDYTQGGHITAAYIHRMREQKLMPADYVPPPYQVKKARKRKAQASTEEEL